MTVAVILTRKGRDVVTTAPDSRMSDVCELLETKGIGAVVVSHGGGRVDGIFSERDFVRAIARKGAAALDLPVGEFMTQTVVTCEPENPIVEVMRRMTQGKFRHMPVVENGRLAGIISIGDVVKHRIAEAEAEASAMREYITA
jgi:CBS domain-containing protein